MARLKFIYVETHSVVSMIKHENRRTGRIPHSNFSPAFIYDICALNYKFLWGSKSCVVMLRTNNSPQFITRRIILDHVLRFWRESNLKHYSSIIISRAYGVEKLREGEFYIFFAPFLVLIAYSFWLHRSASLQAIKPNLTFY